MWGIDVSEHQGVINWPDVAAGGVEYAIIRIGWTHYEGGLTVDDRFHENMRGAIAAGIPVGIYAYAYDLSPEAARKSAQVVAEIIKAYQLEFPVWYDQEDHLNLDKISKQTRTDCCKAFCDEMEQLGYYAGIYSYLSWLNGWVDDSQLTAYDKWVAAYRTDMIMPDDDDRSGYAQPHGMWQYSVYGTIGEQGVHYWTPGIVKGVDGNCDVNVCYKDYPALIRSVGLNHLAPDTTPTTPTEPDYKAMYEQERKRNEALIIAMEAARTTLGAAM